MDFIISDSGICPLIVIKYSLFVAISILVNLFTQYSTDLFYVGNFQTYISLLFGTFAGLVTKYILDKKFIFYYNSSDLRSNLKKFILYSTMGVFTTLIFWGTELSFYYLFEFTYAKFLGGAIGLSIGYLVKYNLDKKYVFNKN